MASGFLSVDEPEDDLTSRIEPVSRSAAPQPHPTRTSHAPGTLAVAEPPASEEEDEEIVLEPDSGTGTGPTAAAEPVRAADATTPEVLDGDYRPLLDRIDHQWRTVVSTAQSEADTIRSNADRDARRIVADAHQERSLLLERAAERLAVTHVETELELARWVSEFDEERRAVLDAAHEEADRLLRVANLAARERAQARSQEAEDAAQRILTDATREADRLLGGISVGTSASSGSVDALTRAPIRIPAPLPALQPPPSPQEITLSPTPAPSPQEITPSPTPAPSSPTAVARPDSTPGTVQDGLSDERHFWEEMFWDCRVDAQPDRPDLGWLVDDSVTLTPVSYTHLTLPTNREV